MKTVEENDLPTQSDVVQELRRQTKQLFSKDYKEMGLWLVRFNGTMGIVKCNYQEKEHTIELLQSLRYIGSRKVTVTTQVTSGTIRTLTHRKRSSKC